MVELDQAAIQTLAQLRRQSACASAPWKRACRLASTIRDEFAAEIAFEERWSEWLDATLDDPDAQQALRPALLEGHDP